MIRLAVRVAREHAELVLTELMVLAPGGLEEREDGDTVEYVLYGAAGEVPDLGSLQAAVGGSLVDVSTTELPDDFGQDWRSFHRPIDAGRCESVRPGKRSVRGRSTSSSSRGRHSAPARTPRRG